MAASTKKQLVRLLPVVLLTLAMAAWFNDVQQGGPYVLRNLLPPLAVVLLCAWTLRRGAGSWAPRADGEPDWRFALGTAGFAIPACGLAIYLHYAYTINLDGYFDDGPGELFRYLPAYTLVAGVIGFAIGWIAGRNI
ncbi:MAG: hypothetical protein R3358_13025 [Woeseiaceae bacterium]|nr:hypothetical protein [Woeseiaceae bacterium]